MRLNSVEVHNFRAFQQAKVTCPDNGLMLVAGANNTGKSALLSALDVAALGVVDTTALRHSGRAEPARVVATFALDDGERSAVLAQAESPDRLLAAQAVTRLEYVFEQHRDGAVPTLVEVRAKWPPHGMLPIAALRPGPRADNTYYLHAVTAAWLRNPDQERPSLGDRGTGIQREAGGGLDTLLGGQQDLAPMAQLLANWRARFYHFRALRPGTAREVVLGSSPSLLPTGENLPAVLLDLRTNRPGIFLDLQRLIAEIVPDIGELQIRTTGDTMRVTFATPAFELNLKDLGTGVEQLLMTLVVGLIEAAPFTLVIEEPETNLHPAAQRALLGLLQGWASDRQIIAATHSPVMLDWTPGGDRLWLVTRDRGTSAVRAVGEDRLALLQSLGVRPSDVLSAERVLVLEGPSDEDVLNVWFPDLLRNPRVAVLYGDGGENARHADRLAEWLTQTDRLGLRRVLYIRDRDELAPPVLEKLVQTPTVHVLARREIENYLLDPAALAIVLQHRVPEGTPAADADAISEVTVQVAEDLRNTIIVNRVARQIAPAQRLMDTDLRHKLADEGADAHGIITAVLERLMKPEALRAQVAKAWDEASADVAQHTGDELLAIAPGKDILDRLFMQFTGTHYKPRSDGVAIARAMQPSTEMRQLLDEFLAE